MFALPCAGRLGNCPEAAKKRFRFTCLYCRWRRRLTGQFTTPPYYIRYTYLSLGGVWRRRRFVKHGKEYTRADGGYLEYTEWRTLLIDPRGHFTAWRCAAIMWLDRFMRKTKILKPTAEFCEFLSNYPTW